MVKTHLPFKDHETVKIQISVDETVPTGTYKVIIGADTGDVAVSSYVDIDFDNELYFEEDYQVMPPLGWTYDYHEGSGWFIPAESGFGSSLPNKYPVFSAILDRVFSASTSLTAKSSRFSFIEPPVPGVSVLYRPMPTSRSSFGILNFRIVLVQQI